MKRVIPIISMLLLAAGGNAGTIQQRIVPTTQFSREALTNETLTEWRAKLGLGSDTNGSLVDILSASNSLQGSINGKVAKAGDGMTGGLTNNSAAGFVGNGILITNLNPTNLISLIPDSKLTTNVTQLGTQVDLGSSEATGTLGAARFPALSGDVTTTAGSLAATIADDAVSNDKLENMANGTIKGRVTSGTGDPEDLNATQAKAVLAITAADITGVVADAGDLMTGGLTNNSVAGFQGNGTGLTNTGSILTTNSLVSSNQVAGILLELPASTNFLNTVGGSSGSLNAGILTNIPATNIVGTFQIFSYRTNATERIYAVESWGAVGDGVETWNSVMSAGSPSLTNTTVTFPTDIVGKSFTMYGAGTNGWNLSGVVLARVSSTVLTLSTNATISQTNRFVYGTDDMDAINLAHDWLATNGLGGTLAYTPGKIYCLGTNLLDVGTPTNHYNAQLRIPYVVQTAGAPTIRITGFQKPSGTYDGTGSSRSAVIWSFYPRGPDGINVASVMTVNALVGSAVGTLQQRMNRARFLVDNIVIRHTYDNNMRSLDLYAAQQANVENFNSEAGYSSAVDPLPQFQTGTNGYALVMPNSVNYNENSARNVASYWDYNGVSPCGAMQGESWQFYGVVNAVQPYDPVIRLTLSHLVTMECSNTLSMPFSAVSADIIGTHIYNSTRFSGTRNLIFAPQNSFSGFMTFMADNPPINTRVSIIGDVSKARIIQIRGDLAPIDYSPFLCYSNIISSNNVQARAAMMGSLYGSGLTYGAFGNTNGVFALLCGTAGDTFLTAGLGQTIGFWNNGIGTQVGSAAINLWTFNTAVNVTSGRITNGNSVWFDRTNVAPPSSLNKVWLATDTNAPTLIFVGNNGTWTAK